MAVPLAPFETCRGRRPDLSPPCCGWRTFSRFDFDIPRHETVFALSQTPLVVVVQIASLLGFGVYRFIWRYIGIRDLPAVRSGGPDCCRTARRAPRRPARFVGDVARAAVGHVPVDHSSALSTIAVRVIRRVIYEQYQRPRGAVSPTGSRVKPVLLIGAGRAGKTAADEIRRVRSADLEIEGFVDDDPPKQRLGHPRRQGDRHDAATCRAWSRARDRSRGDHHRRRLAPGPPAHRRDLRADSGAGAHHPSPAARSSRATSRVSRIRDVQIEDLLGRAPVQLDKEAAIGSSARQDRASVTGAGGSIGRELARQVLPLRAVAAAARRARRVRPVQHRPRAGPRALPDGDIAAARRRRGTDRERTQIFSRHMRPTSILHAAAHKHVPMMERNPARRSRTTCSARVPSPSWPAAARRRRVRADFDRQGGATRRRSWARPSGSPSSSCRASNAGIGTRFVTVRFGNVLGSAGSVCRSSASRLRRAGRSRSRIRRWRATS